MDQRLVSMRRSIAVLMGLLVPFVFVRPSHAAPPALRSGTIVGGYYPFAVALAPGPGPDCRTNVDCIPWLVAGCPEQMVGIDPALHSSIVHVGNIAGKKRLRTLTVETDARPVMFGGVSVQFWDRSCGLVRQLGGNSRTAIEDIARFTIPKTARWMTVASVDTPPLEWTLR